MRVMYFVTLGAIVAVLIQGAILGVLFQVSETLENTSNETVSENSTFVGPALNLVKTGSFSKEGKHVGLVQRGPGYATLLAAAFFVFGEYVAVVFLINFFALLASLFLLWRISIRFLPGLWQFAPSCMLALFWGATVYVWIGNYELFTLCLVTATILCAIKYSESSQLVWLGGTALLLSLWILERPLFLYFIPIILGFLLFTREKYLSRRALFLHVFVLIGILAVVIGSWSYRNFRTIGTWQLGSGGHILLRRATQIDFSKEETASLFLSYAVGNAIAREVYDPFPRTGEPHYWDSRIEKRMDASHDLILLDHDMHEEALEKIKKAPGKFFLTGIAGLFRLNAPVNYNGAETMNMFAENTHELSRSYRLAILAALRTAWYLFLGVTFFALCIRVYQWRTWGFLALLIVYGNGMHALFTHAEVRYLLTIQPFYFLFFVEGMRQLFFFARANKLTPTGNEIFQRKRK